MNERRTWLLWGLLMTVSLVPAASMADYCEVRLDPFPYTAPHDLEECPRDIQAWMDRTNGCADIRAQEKKGHTEPEVLEDMSIDLECALLSCDYIALIKKYKGNGVLTDIINGYKINVYGKEAGPSCEY